MRRFLIAIALCITTVALSGAGSADAAKTKTTCAKQKPKVVRTQDKDGGVASSWRQRKRICMKMGLQNLGQPWDPSWPIEGPDGVPLPTDPPTTDIVIENGVPMEYVCEPGYPQCGEYPPRTTNRTKGMNMTGGLAPVYPNTTSIIQIGHRWLERAAAYWGSRDICRPWEQQIVWVDVYEVHWLGRSPLGGCFIDGKRWVELNNAKTPRTQGFPPENAWCAVVLHEQGHQLGYYWQQYEGYPWYDGFHNYDWYSIMWPTAISVPAICRY